MSVVAYAIEEAAAALTCSGPHATSVCKKVWGGDKDHLKLWLIVQGYFESGYALDVHNGACNLRQNGKYQPRCDFGRSASVWQLQRGYHFPFDRWRKTIGVSAGSTNYAAYQAGLNLSRSYNACFSQNGYAGMVSMYATGNSCYWEPRHAHGPIARVAFFNSRVTQARSLKDKK